MSATFKEMPICQGGGVGTRGRGLGGGGTWVSQLIFATEIIGYKIFEENKGNTFGPKMLHYALHYGWKNPKHDAGSMGTLPPPLSTLI